MNMETLQLSGFVLAVMADIVSKPEHAAWCIECTVRLALAWRRNAAQFFLGERQRGSAISRQRSRPFRRGEPRLGRPLPARFSRTSRKIKFKRSG